MNTESSVATRRGAVAIARSRLGLAAASAVRYFHHLRLIVRVAAVAAALIATASFAHNLGQSATFLAFDKPTLDQMSTRAGLGQPIIKSGDVVSFILKSTPGPGTATGAGGYMTFYIPAGTQVVGVEYVRPDPTQVGSYLSFPLPGPAIMPIGSGPIGQTCPAPPPNLQGVTLGPNILGVSETPVVPGTGCHRGTNAGVYGDIGVFYSTDPRTAFNSWSGGALTNNRGVTSVPTTKWDAYQLLAYGVKSPSLPIIDKSDGRGNAPWGLASPVAGPQSGYAWQFDKDIYDANPARPAADYLTVGPWQRVRHPGSQIAKDQAGLVSSVLGYAGVDANQIGGAATGVLVDSANPLPVGVTAVRIAHGGLELGRPETVRLKLKVLVDPTPNVAPYDAQSCFVMNADAFGGDAGGEEGGKDHLWRYYEPVKRSLNPCATIQKIASANPIPAGGTFTYRIDFVNQSASPLTNVTISDPLPSGLTFVSASPAQTSGPNPLTWTIPTAAANTVTSFFVTVKATGAGEITNGVTALSNGSLVASGQDTVLVGSEALLRYTKTVTPSSVSPGQTVQYTLDVINDGSGPQSIPLVVTEILPAGFTYQGPLVSAAVNGGPLPPATVTVNSVNPNKPVFSVAAPIQPRNKLTLVFNVLVGAQVAGGTYPNLVQLAYNGKVIGGTPSAPVTVAVSTIGDTVYRDWNDNGVQDSTDEGVPGATVNLHGGACPPAGPVVQTTATDPSGKYLFNGAAPGAYCVSVGGTAVAGYTGATTQAVTIASGTTNLGVDFPLVPGGTGQIGDRVFDDLDRSGTLTAGDVGISGVTVQLYEDTNGDGVIGAQDALIRTTTTDGTGTYSFTGLATGIKYIAKLASADPALVAYYGAGVAYSSSTPLSQASSLTAGVPTDLARDFGFSKPGAIGDQVYIDSNGNGSFDPGEPPLSNIVVALRDGNGNVLATTVTDPNGNYLFGNLPAATYSVTVDTTTVPADLVPASLVSRTVAITAGQQLLSVDFGFRVGLSKTVNAAVATNGQTLTYTINPFYPGPALLANAGVTDPIPNIANAAPTSPTYLATYVANSANAGGVLVPETPGVVGPPAEPAIPASIFWDLGNNTAALSGVIPPAGVAFCPAPSATINITTDTYIRQDQATNNFGNGTTIVTRPANATTHKHGLLLIDLASAGIPANAIIQSATLKLRSEGKARNNHFIQVHRMLTAWTEGTGAAGSGATWNTRNGTTAWAGGAFSSTDYDAATVAIFRPIGGNKFVNVDITSLVKQWAAGTTNNGLVMLATGTDANDGAWSSSDNATAANRPTVTVKYILSQSGTPGAVACQSAVGGDVLNPDYDTFVDSNAPTANQGAAPELKSDAAGNLKRPLLHFDLGGVPLGATIATATLALTQTSGDNNAHTESIRRMITPWSDLANWNTRNSSVAWSSGTTFSASDYAGTGADFTRSGDGTSAVSVQSLVDSWVNGGLPNNGAAVLPTVTNGSEYRFGSLENGTVASRPKLTVVWQQLYSNQVGTTVDLHATPLLVSGSGAVSMTVTMTVSASTGVTGVTPPATLTISPSGLGAVPTCAAPSPAGPVNIDASTPATFTYACSVTPGTNPGTVAFAGKPTAAGASFASATSEEAIVTPPLTFQATVTASSGTVANTATFADDGATSIDDTALTNLGAGISGKVWSDTNGNGTLDAGEGGVAGVEVCASNGTPICTTTTADGTYALTGLAAGTWTVTETPSTFPPGTVPTTPTTQTVSLVALEQKANVNFGLQPGTNTTNPATIGDTLWVDANGDGIVDLTETLLAGVTVKLWVDIDNNGALDPAIDYQAATTTTNANGNYQFTDLAADRYLVQADAATGPLVGSGYGVVSLSDVPVSGNPPPVIAVNLGTGATVASADFGFYYTGRIGDQLFYDTNGNGTQDPGEQPTIVPVTVVLYNDVDGNGALTPGTDTIAAVTQSDGAGKYFFRNLPAGKYVVVPDEQSVPDPVTGAYFSMVPTGNGAYPVTLAAGQQFLNADFGFAFGALVEGAVFQDNNVDAIFDGGDAPLAGITVTLNGTDSNSNPVLRTTTTGAGGDYAFLVPPGSYTVTYTYGGTLTKTTTPLSYLVSPVAGEEIDGLDFGRILPGAIGDTLYADNNSNGSQDSGEPGLGGVAVELYSDPGFTSLLATTATDAAGRYLFQNLANGTYYVQVNTTAGSLPPGYATTPTGDPDATKDGRATVTLASGGDNLTADFGYPPTVPVFSVSGNVWQDNGAGGGTANNGVRDGSEPPIAGVRLVVIADIDHDGIADLTIPVTTDATGNYSAGGLPSGADVVIAVDSSSLPPGSFQTGDPNEAGRCVVCDGRDAVAGIAANVTNRNFGFAFPAPATATDLAVVKTGTATVGSNGAVSYTLVVSNAGPAAADGAVVTDLAVANFTATGVTCGAASGSAVCPTVPNTTLALLQGTGIVIPTLPSGGSVTFALSGTAGISGAIANVATVTAPAGITDGTPGNNSGTANTSIVTQADLTISKSANPNPYVPGALMSYTVTVSNVGPADATGARVQDTFPTALAAFTWTCTPSGAGASCATPSGTGNIDALVTLPSGTHATFTVTGTVPPGTTGSLANTATVTPPVGITDPIPGNNTATDNNPAGPQADLTVTKVGSPKPYVPGSPMTYTIVATNGGPSNVTNARVQDALPPALAGFTWTCTPSGAGAACGTASATGDIDALVTLPTGTSATFAVTGTVPPGTTGALLNAVTIAPPVGVSDPVPGNNLASDNNPVGPVADLGVTKVGNPNPYVPGAALTYTVVVSNAGPSNVVNARVQDVLPAELASFTWACVPAGAGAVCGTAAGSGNIDALVSLPVGATATFSITGTVPPGTVTSLTNTATVTAPLGITDPVLANNSATATFGTTVADLAIAKTSTASVNSNGAVSYTLVVSNNGPAAADGALLKDAVAANFVAASVTCDSASGSAACPTVPNTTLALLQGAGIVIPTLPSGGSVTFTLSGTAGVSGQIFNTATISAPAGITDGTPGNNASMANTVITTTVADLSIAKTGTLTVGSNGAVSYTLVVSNAGPAAVDGALVTDPVVANFTATGVACSAASGSAVCPTAPNTTLALLQGAGIVIPTLSSGGSITLTLTGTAAISGSIANVATVAAPAGITDPTPGNNSSTANTSIVTQADLTISKSANPNPYVPGAAMTYTITVSNVGPADVSGARVQDTFPAALAAFTWTCTPSGVGASCATPSGTGNIDALVTLPSGTHATFSVTGTVPPGTTGSLANTATVAPPVGITDPIPGNNSATDNNPAGPKADLSVTKVGSPKPYVPGLPMTYTIVATNNGPSNVTSARVQDALPVALAGFTWTCTPSGAGASCGTALGSGDIDVLVTLPTGTSTTFSVTGTVPPATTGALLNAVTVNPPVGVTDPVPGNNLASDNNPVGPVADLGVSKLGAPNPYVPGAALTYTVVVSNAGPSNATNARVQDVLPAELASFTWTCVPSGAGAVCGTLSGSGNIDALVTLPVGTTATFAITGTVPPGTITSLTNTVTVTAPLGLTDPVLANNSATATFGTTVADLGIVKTGTVAVSSNGAVSYTLVVTNNGPAAADGALVKDAVAANFAATSVTCGSASGSAVCPTVPDTTLALLQGSGIVIPTLPNGGSVTFSLSGTAAANGSIANTATVTAPAGVSDNNAANNSSTANTALNVMVADLSIVKSGPASVNSNGAVNYTLVIQNNGPAAADGAVLTDPAVANFTVSSVSCNIVADGAACPAAPVTTVALLQGSGIVIPTLPNGGSITFTASGTAAASGSITNGATIAPPAGIADGTQGNNTSAANTSIGGLSLSDPAISKTGPTTIGALDAIAYIVVVTNSGPAPADGAVVRDVVVPNFNATSVNCVAAGGAVCPAAATVANLQGPGLVIAALPMGGTITLTLSGTAGGSGSIVNTATVSAPNGVTDTTPANNSSSASTTIISSVVGIPTLTPWGLALLTIMFGMLVAYFGSRRRR